MTSSSSPSVPNLIQEHNSFLQALSPRPNPPFKPKFPRHKSTNPINSPSSSTSVPPCTECGKRFLSWKALFGHMRCHPERQWRGINPPPNHHCPLLIDAHHFTVEEYEVADSLVMLASGIKRRIEVEHRSGVRFKGFSAVEGGGGSSFSPRDYVLDLNLPPPPPLEGDGLDLRVGLM